MHLLAGWTSKLTLVALLALPAAWAADRDADFSDAELDRLLAPIALYPDTVLSHVLIAATYPLDVVEAARWSRGHPDLRGEQAVAAVEAEDWDASVKALVAFPELLARMDEDLDWTRDLGDAFLAQEHAVADRVQHLRRRAYDTGHLDALEHVRVVHEPDVIYIEPAVTRVIYVPVYDTRIVYGSWWWPAHPPVYWAFPHHHHGAIWYWGHGFHIAPSFYFSAWHWPQRRVVVTRHVHHHHFYSGREVARHREARHWRHDRSHHRNVTYRQERRRQEHAAGSPIRHARRERELVHRPSGEHAQRADSWRETGDRRSGRVPPLSEASAARDERNDRGRGSNHTDAEAPQRAGRRREGFHSSGEVHDGSSRSRRREPAAGEPRRDREARGQNRAQAAAPAPSRRGDQEQRGRRRRDER